MTAAVGDSLTLQSRWHDAAQRYEEAIPALHSQPGNPERLAFATANLARIHVELGRPARALASLEQLANKLDAQPPQLRPLIELTLARALWDTGGDRQRACQLAGRARASASTIAGVSRRDLDAIERWPASHRGC
jgi:tetratricopeptide (TPR) repeat protein